MSADKLQYVSKVKADTKKADTEKRKTKKKDAEKEDMKTARTGDHAAGGPGERAVFLSAAVCVLKISFLLFRFSCDPESFQDRLCLLLLLQSRFLRSCQLFPSFRISEKRC